MPFAGGSAGFVEVLISCLGDIFAGDEMVRKKVMQALRECCKSYVELK